MFWPCGGSGNKLQTQHSDYKSAIGLIVINVLIDDVKSMPQCERVAGSDEPTENYHLNL